MKINYARFELKRSNDKSAVGTGTISACVIDMFAHIQDAKVREMALQIMQGVHKNMVAREKPHRLQARGIY